MAHSLEARSNTRYVWIGLDVSCEHPDWLGLGKPLPQPNYQ